MFEELDCIKLALEKRRGEGRKVAFKTLFEANTPSQLDEFHQKCDNMGPTLTVLYGTRNVLFGGYTSKNWVSSQSKTPVDDPEAFLFVKPQGSSASLEFFPDKSGKGAITCYADYGPTFGGGTFFRRTFDLQTFVINTSKRSRNETNGVVKLNSALNFGTAYKSQDKTFRKDLVNGGTLDVHKIAVYQVSDYYWRPQPEKTEIQEQKNYLCNLETRRRQILPYYNIVLLGVVGAGKSSLYNTIASAVRHDLMKGADTGQAAKSVTKSVHKYELLKNCDEDINIRIFDVRGITAARDLCQELEHILTGRLPVGYEFPDAPRDVPIERLVKGTSIADVIHLAVIVCDVQNWKLAQTEQEDLASLMSTMDFIRRKDIPLFVVATKCDKLDEDVKNDVKRIYRSRAVFEAMEILAQKTGVSMHKIHPVVNYAGDVTLSDDKDALAIQILYSMVKIIEDYWELHKEQINWDAILTSFKRMGMCSKQNLKGQKNLPDQKQLNKLLEIHIQNRSDASLDALKHVEDIAQNIVRSKYPKVKKVWLAYRYKDELKGGVIMVNSNCKDEDVNCLGLETCVYTQDDISKEAREITAYCREQKLDNSASFEEQAKALKCLNRIADEIMKCHRFLSIIKPSPVRSKGFSSSNHTIVKENCIALYVQKKGFIPVSEEPFQRNYRGFEVDVREGAFNACMHNDREEIKTLKMGFRISRVLPNSLASDSFGTLGGFLEHPEYGTCGITCAHVLLDENEMAELHEKRVLTWMDLKSDILVNLYKDDGHQTIGRFVKAVYEKGDRGNNGFEAAIFQINEDLQTAGAFWNVTVKSDDKEHRFNVGKMRSASRLGTSSGIVKFGATTGKTEGKFTTVIPSISVKFQSDRLPDSIVLHNQIEVKGDPNSDFCKKGDSGSLVMVKGAKGETSCVGILEGITDHNTCVASPVGPILERINVSSLKCFEQEQLVDKVRGIEVDVKKILAILEQMRCS